MTKKKLSMFSVVVIVLGMITACGSQDTAKAEGTDVKPVNVTNIKGKNLDQKAPATAMAELYNAKKEKVGTAHLTESKEGVKIHIMASTLSPGPHGFHIHKVAKCIAPDFESAGEHFNPGKKEHGFENPKGFHAGDLPNIDVNKDGMVKATAVTKNVTLQKGKPNSLFDKDGSAIVIHEKPDDYKTDPDGKAGKRVACGAIQPAAH
ncbi:superoxide dismutase family protein [Alkalihalobacillus sp. AL-G]|uniref:superoxide dismutase family protein n=1 Tax=Alkalihalobacillus sp. AL-G TaxID=2926399 RepID=UPI00272BA6B7|nr:superoxide dismutase family protein [Alkalihalobacillus sp. AL-G]WLD92474.1 superoxide dismutase family protein [Alkalihalobacillus sp. AL-G]